MALMRNHAVPEARARNGEGDKRVGAHRAAAPPGRR